MSYCLTVLRFNSTVIHTYCKTEGVKSPGGPPSLTLVPLVKPRQAPPMVPLVAPPAGGRCRSRRLWGGSRRCRRRPRGTRPPATWNVPAGGTGAAARSGDTACAPPRCEAVTVAESGRSRCAPLTVEVGGAFCAARWAVPTATRPHHWPAGTRGRTARLVRATGCLGGRDVLPEPAVAAQRVVAAFAIVAVVVADRL